MIAGTGGAGTLPGHISDHPAPCAYLHTEMLRNA